MGHVHKYRSGVIFDDRFDTIDNSRWIVSPSQSYSREEEGLVLNHSSTGTTTALFEFPDEGEILFEVYAEYNPSVRGDEGGIVVWKSNSNKLEFLESSDTRLDVVYDSWRVIKSNNLFVFYGRRDGEWELFDSSICINPSLAGIVLKGKPKEGVTDLKVKRAILCRGNKLTVGNLNSGSVVTLLNANGEEIDSQEVPEGFSGLSFDLPEIPFTGKVLVLDSLTGEESYSDDSVDFYGGDVFLLGSSLKVYRNGEELNSTDINHLGSLKEDLLEERLTLKNLSAESAANDVELKVGLYEDHFGWEWADISLDSSEGPSEYKKSLEMGTIGPGEEVSFWIRIENKKDRFTTRPTMFSMEITSK